jgi:hypothetical protein
MAGARHNSSQQASSAAGRQRAEPRGRIAAATYEIWTRKWWSVGGVASAEGPIFFLDRSAEPERFPNYNGLPRQVIL